MATASRSLMQQQHTSLSLSLAIVVECALLWLLVSSVLAALVSASKGNGKRAKSGRGGKKVGGSSQVLKGKGATRFYIRRRVRKEQLSGLWINRG